MSRYTIEYSRERGPQGASGSTDASAITSGTVAFERLPTGTSGSTVAVGNHTHGSITTDGKLGSTANKPLITGASGVVTAGSFGTAENTFCEGDDYRLDASKCRCGILANVTTEDTSAGPRFIEYFDGYMWGVLSGDIYRSSNEGVTWTLYCNSWPDTGDDAFISRIIKTSDGEVIAMSQTKIRKSSGWSTGNSATWSSPKVAPNGTSTFVGFSLDGDGTKFILGEYSTTWADSRKVHISVDSGATFEVKYDTLTLHGSTVNNNSHIHGVCYDSIGDRFYVGEGHGTAGGIYVSTNNGTTWTLLNRDVFTMGDGNYNAPTVITATNEGLVCGSDHGNNGLFGIVRKTTATEEVPFITLPIRTGRDGLVMFAQRGWKDPDTGDVYVTFRSEFNDVRPCIAVGTPTHGALIYEWPTLPVVGGSDRFYFAAKVSDQRLVAYAEFDATPTTLKADLPKATSTSVQALDRGGLLGGTSHATSVSAGQRAIASGVESVAIGVGATTSTYADSVAVGHGSSVTANAGIAIGSASTAGGSGVAIGPDATSNAAAVAIGASAVNVNPNAVAVGYVARSNINGVAIGFQANAEDYGNAVAIGSNTRATGTAQVHFGARHIELLEQSEPDAAATNGARIFAKDNGSGKTQLCVRFASGATQVIATEP